MSLPAFRRRILIESSPGCVVAELEDDWHRMVVTVRHEDGTARSVEGEMKRWPWTTCQGAIAQLAETFTGHALADFARRGAKKQNCTHLHDLAIFAAGHAHETAPVTFDVTVTDPVAGRRTAQIVRNGEVGMTWTLEDATLFEPPVLAGLMLYTLNDWIAGLDPASQETARILRWASILAHGRAMDIPEGMSGTAFPSGSCYTFQPELAASAVRRPDVPRDFSQTGITPLADRSLTFRNLQETSS